MYQEIYLTNNYYFFKFSAVCYTAGSSILLVDGPFVQIVLGKILTGTLYIRGDI